MAGNGIIRTLYNKTLETFPAAEILLTAAILISSAILNFFIYTQNWRIVAFAKNEESTDKNVYENKTDMFEEPKQARHPVH